MSTPSTIKDVWAHNLAEEMAIVSSLLSTYPLIGMDTEFPGVVANYDSPSTEYSKVKKNVNILNLIQFGISLSDPYGNTPSPVSTWQFNFKFDLNEEVFREESIILLKNNFVDFSRMAVEGIDPIDFGHYAITSGLVFNPDICYFMYHGAYDIAYLLKAVTCKALPDTLDEFNTMLAVYIPRFIDLKSVVKDSKKYSKNGLSGLSEKLGVNRIGQSHQAGSDSLLTIQCALELIHRKNKPYGQFMGNLYGIKGD